MQNRSGDLGDGWAGSGSKGSHEDEEGGGRALGLASGSGGLLPLAGAAGGLEPAGNENIDVNGFGHGRDPCTLFLAEFHEKRRSYLPSPLVEASALPFMVVVVPPEAGWEVGS
jgi:hypothetical protein